MTVLATLTAIAEQPKYFDAVLSLQVVAFCIALLNVHEDRLAGC